MRIFKILLQGPLEEDLKRNSTRSSQGPVREHVRTPRGFHQDLFKSLSQGPVQDHAQAPNSMSLGSLQELLTRICKRPRPRPSCQDPYKRRSQDCHKRSWCCWSGSYKISRQEPPKCLPLPPTKAFIQAPLRHGICKIFMQGPLRKDPSRISTRSSIKDLCRIMPGPSREGSRRISRRARSPGNLQ